jgi:hypothetical protein
MKPIADRQLPIADLYEAMSIWTKIGNRQS